MIDWKSAFCADQFSVFPYPCHHCVAVLSSTPVKVPAGSVTHDSAKSTGGRLQLNTHAPRYVCAGRSTDSVKVEVAVRPGLPVPNKPYSFCGRKSVKHS